MIPPDRLFLENYTTLVNGRDRWNRQLRERI